MEPSPSAKAFERGPLSLRRPPHRDSITAMLKVIRPPNAVMVGIAVVVGAMVSAGGLPEAKATRLLLGFLTGFTVSGASMVINDIMDVNVDRVNAPHRPLASGLLAVRDAWMLFLALSIAGLACGAALGWVCFAVAAFSLLSACSYSLSLKRTGLLGNAVVSVNTAIPLLYGGLLARGVNTPLAIFITMVFLANMGREIVKGIADVEGDARAGVKTLAVVRGPRYAARAAAAFVAVAVILSPLPVVMGYAGAFYAALVTIANVVLLYSVHLVLKRCDRVSALKSKRLMLLAMAMGLASFALSTL